MTEEKYKIKAQCRNCGTDCVIFVEFGKTVAEELPKKDCVHCGTKSLQQYFETGFDKIFGAEDEQID